jgi:hypothetical protein
VVELSSRSLLIVTFGPPSGPPSYAKCTNSKTVVVDDLDSEPSLTPIETPTSSTCVGDGSLGIPSITYLLRLSPTRALLAHGDPDSGQETADDGVYLLDDLGGENRVTSLPTGTGSNLNPWNSRLSDDSALVVSSEAPLLLTDLGGTNQMTSLAPWNLWGPWVPLGPQTFIDAGNPPSFVRVEGASVVDVQPLVTPETGEIVALSPTTALIGRYLVSDLGGSNAVATLPSASAWVRLTAKRVLGVDPGGGALVMVDDLGGSNRVVHLPVAGITGAPIALGPAAAAVATTTGVALLRGLGTSNEVTIVPIASVNPFLLALGHRALVAPVHGPGGDQEDVMALIRTRAEHPRTRRIPMPGIAELAGYVALAALGDGRFVFADWGYPIPLGTTLRIFGGVRDGVRFAPRRLEIRPRVGGGSLLRATARLVLPDPSELGVWHLTIRIGGTSQTLSPADLARTPRGYAYSDPTGAHGVLRGLDYDSASGRVSIEGVDTGTQAAESDPERLLLSFESPAFYAAEFAKGVRSARGISFRARRSRP